jgi:hypothetical protein
MHNLCLDSARRHLQTDPDMRTHWISLASLHRDMRLPLPCPQIHPNLHHMLPELPLLLLNDPFHFPTPPQTLHPPSIPSNSSFAPFYRANAANSGHEGALDSRIAQIITLGIGACECAHLRAHIHALAICGDSVLLGRAAFAAVADACGNSRPAASRYPGVSFSCSRTTRKGQQVSPRLGQRPHLHPIHRERDRPPPSYSDSRACSMRR